MIKLSLEQFCNLLGVLPDNALIVGIWKTLELNGYAIVQQQGPDGRRSANFYGERHFEDYTSKNEHNLTEYANQLKVQQQQKD